MSQHWKSRTHFLVHTEIIPITCYTKFHSSFSRKGQDPCPSFPLFHQYFKQCWQENSAWNNSQRNEDKAASVDASQGPDIPTHLLMNRPVSICCSAVDRDIQITETTVYLKVLGTIGAGAGIGSHALIDKNLIVFPVLCSTPATAGDLRERSSWSYTLH